MATHLADALDRVVAASAKCLELKPTNRPLAGFELPAFQALLHGVDNLRTQPPDQVVTVARKLLQDIPRIGETDDADYEHLRVRGRIGDLAVALHELVDVSLESLASQDAIQSVTIRKDELQEVREDLQQVAAILTTLKEDQQREAFAERAKTGVSLSLGFVSVDIDPLLARTRQALNIASDENGAPAHALKQVLQDITNRSFTFYQAVARQAKHLSGTILEAVRSAAAKAASAFQQVLRIVQRELSLTKAASPLADMSIVDRPPEEVTRVWVQLAQAMSSAVMGNNVLVLPEQTRQDALRQAGILSAAEAKAVDVLSEMVEMRVHRNDKVLRNDPQWAIKAGNLVLEKLRADREASYTY